MDVAREAVSAGGTAALAWWKKDLTAETKADTTPVSYPGLVLDDDGDYYNYGEQRHRLAAAVTLPWNRVDFRAALSLGYQLEERYAIDETTEEFDDEVILTEGLSEDRSSALWGRLSFFNGTSFFRSHSIEDGRYLSVVAERADKALGSEIERIRLRGDWSEYLPLAWENHVIKLEASYGHSWGDETAQGAFGLGGLGFSLVSASLGVERGISLRGYESNYQVGDEAVKVGLAYRLPLWQPYRNINATSPFYLQQLFLELFYEGGRVGDSVFADADDDTDWLNAAGVEVNFATKLLRFLPVAPGIGVAYAFDREERGDDEDRLSEKLSIYFSIKTSVNF